MQNKLLSEIIGSDEAPVIVLFGGNPERRDEVLRLLSSLGDVTVHGTLGEEEGKAKIEALNYKVDLALIGGRYTDQQRIRIKQWLKKQAPHIQTTEPGLDYPYSNPGILDAVRNKTSNL